MLASFGLYIGMFILTSTQAVIKNMPLVPFKNIEIETNLLKIDNQKIHEMEKKQTDWNQYIFFIFNFINFNYKVIMPFLIFFFLILKNNYFSFHLFFSIIQYYILLIFK